ncbi:MAG TPA: hypothetical protein VE127_03010, partial [Solirubrobacteraceae bacterium]|nr:hypothetical protein [Solirubrobacteraceae bacterium]
MAAPIGLQPTADLAERVLLPGDPARALLLAESLLSGTKMFNHHRGLWGYTGLASDDAPLTIQSTGMGGPSAAIVISELAGMGARRMLRVGTCGALHPGLALGDLLVATEAIPADGTSRALRGEDRIPAGADLTAALSRSSRSGVAGIRSPAPSERLVPSAGIASVASSRSPNSRPACSAPHVPTRNRRRAPRSASSETTIAALGPPTPVLWIVSGAPSGAS